MKRLLNYIPLHFLICLILGICLQFYYNIWSFSFYKLLISLAVLLSFLFIVKHKIVNTLCSWSLFFLIGVSCVYFSNDINYKNHYSNYFDINTPKLLKIKTVLKPGNYYDKYEATVVQIKDFKTIGEVLLNVRKDSINSALKVDEILYTSQVFKDLIPPLNPHQFDYKEYLAKKGIIQQVFIDSNQFKTLSIKKNSLVGLSAIFRNKIQESLKKYQFKDNEYAVINALLLGQRQDISKELINDYSRAGAIHILAVSGLHVGIILLILNWLFKPIEILKNGRYIKIVITVLLLWMFAFIAGLSASVVRAVTMFTFLAIGMSFKQKSFVEFSLISSMFILLLIKPMFLFDVGFQLSYLAVFGIVWVQPRMYKVWSPKNKIIDKFWQLTTVSVAAQVGILPLSLYYFHQFPGLFILSNLMIIPFLGVILFGGILVIILSLLGILPQIIANIYGFIIGSMNSFVSWISHQEQFLFKEISLSLSKMITLYFVIILGVYFLLKVKPKKLIYFLGAIIFLQGVVLYENYKKSSKKEFIVFHKSRYSIVGDRVGENIKIYHNLDTVDINKTNIMTSYKVGENISQYYTNVFPNILQLEKQNIIIVDSLGVYELKELKNAIVLLQNSPKINLERLINTINPKQIIADGSNYKSYVTRWENTSNKLMIPFHYTGQKGYYIYKY